MMNTDFYKRCIETLEKAYQMLIQQDAQSISYDLYRSACIKEFEIILEQSGKLLKKTLIPWFHSPKAIDRLMFKDIFRQAAKHDLISLEEAERWLQYRDNRNNTTHDYGVKFAEETLVLIPGFIKDAKVLEKIITRHLND